MSFLSIKLMGGLGNQMFQSATALSFAWKNNFKPIFPEECDQTQTRKKSYKNTVFRKLERGQINLSNFKIYKEPNFYYNEIVADFKLLYLVGYFQSYRYFNDYKNQLKNTFSCTQEIKKTISKYNFENSLSIHVRRGDYLNLSHIHKNLPIAYFDKALKYFNDILLLNVYIFSDDIEWCKNQSLFNSIKNVKFITEEDDVSLYMMNECTFHIISNSSFGWWGAYLSNSKKVICPSEWFSTYGPKYKIEDLIPHGWIII